MGLVLRAAVLVLSLLALPGCAGRASAPEGSGEDGRSLLGWSVRELGGQQRHTGWMASLPAGLPPANSRKWHGRRGWDTLGYIRVRSMANPEWHRDVRWLRRVLRLEREKVSAYDRALLDEAIAALGRYAHAAGDQARRELAWAEVLRPIDAFLEARQAEHLARVAEAGASGRQEQAPSGE